MALVVAGLATWRLAVLLVDDELLARPRDWLGRWAWTSYLISCIACVSVWIGAGVAVGYFYWSDLILWILLPFALSAVALLLERVGS